jgi:hypothetical protein
MSELVFIEAPDATSTGGSTIDEYLRLCEPVIEERGTASASVTMDETGAVLTPAGYSDNSLDVSAAGGPLVASRRLSGRTWTGESAADFLTQNWFTAKAEHPQRFGQLEYASAHWLYSGKHQDGTPLRAAPTTPLWDASVSRFTPDGTAIVLIEFRAQREVWVWLQDARTGARRTVCALPQEALLGDISISGDGRWLLAGQGTILLVDLASGAVVQVPDHITSACWLTTEGPSVLLAGRNIARSATQLGRYDLADGRWETTCEVDTWVGELDVARDGRIAAVVGVPGEQNWVGGVALIDGSSGKVDDVLSRRYRCGPWRRTSRPRWIAGQPATADPVGPAPALIGAAANRSVQPTGEDAQRSFDEWMDRLQRRVQVLENSADTVVIHELVALADMVNMMNPSAKEANQSILVPFLNGLARSASSPDARRDMEWAVRQLLTM